MKSIYVPFSKPMVIANRLFQKNQTRRIMNLETGHIWNSVDHFEYGLWHPYLGGAMMGLPSIKCPFGEDGDLLCVKESLIKSGMGAIIYHADGNFCLNPHNPGNTNLDNSVSLWQWKVNRLIPRYMPHWACRSKYPILKISCERLLRISEEDAIGEGLENFRWNGERFWKNYHHVEFGPEHRIKAIKDPRDSYFSLWDSLHPDRLHDTNPWVWKIKYDNQPPV